MDNQHKKMAGYRDLSQAEIDAGNRLTQVEAVWNGEIDRLRSIDTVDQRQVSIAATEGEAAFMRARRAIYRPQRLTPPDLAPPGYEKEKEPGKEPKAGEDFDAPGTPTGYANGIPHKRAPEPMQLDD